MYESADAYVTEIIQIYQIQYYEGPVSSYPGFKCREDG